MRDEKRMEEWKNGVMDLKIAQCAGLSAWGKEERRER